MGLCFGVIGHPPSCSPIEQWRERLASVSIVNTEKHCQNRPTKSIGSKINYEKSFFTQWRSRRGSRRCRRLIHFGRQLFPTNFYCRRLCHQFHLRRRLVSRAKRRFWLRPLELRWDRRRTGRSISRDEQFLGFGNVVDTAHPC